MKRRRINYFIGIKRFIYSINALMYRELKTKISKSTLGLIGVFAEPLFSLLIFILIFSLRNSSTVGGLNTLIFLSSGILIFTIFSNIAFRSLNSIEANQSLLKTYRPLNIIDTVIARSLIEIYLNIILFLLILVSIYLYNSKIIISNFSLGAFIIFLNAIFSFGVGLIILVVSAKFPFTTNLVPLITRPLFLISGIFYPFIILPEFIKKYITWNPILHFIELLRSSFSNNYKIDYRISISYAIYSAFTTLIIGLILYFSLEEQIKKT